MESLAGKIERKDGSELVSDDSVTESRESGGSTSCESRSSSDHSSSAQLGWPIRKAVTSSGNDFSEGKRKPRLNVDGSAGDASILKKHDSKASGQLFNYLNLYF